MSAADYAASVWNNSSRAKKVDVTINETARIVSGCLKPTPIEKIYPIIGVFAPKIRRKVAAEIKKNQTKKRL